MSDERRQLAEEMRADEHLLGLRFTNLTRGIGPHLELPRHRLIFATALVKREPQTAALIAGRVFEHLILLVARQLSITVVVAKGGSKIRTIIDYLSLYRKQTSDLLASTPEELHRLCDIRNDAVHGEHGTEGNPISAEHAEELVNGVRKMSDAWERYCGRGPR